MHTHHWPHLGHMLTLNQSWARGIRSSWLALTTASQPVCACNRWKGILSYWSAQPSRQPKILQVVTSSSEQPHIHLPWYHTNISITYVLYGASQESACQAGDTGSIPGFNPWVGKIPRRRKLQPPPVFLPGKCHGQRSLVGCNPLGCKELDMTERLSTHNLVTKQQQQQWLCDMNNSGKDWLQDQSGYSQDTWEEILISVPIKTSQDGRRKKDMALVSRLRRWTGNKRTHKGANTWSCIPCHQLPCLCPAPTTVFMVPWWTMS